MATPQSDPAAALTEVQRTAQARQAAITAALVAYYYRTRVDVDNPSSIDQWLALVVPKILADRARLSRASASYGDTLRRLELPKATDGFRFDPTIGQLDASVVRSSLMAVGPQSVISKLSEPTQLDKATLIADANRVAQTKITGSVMRHVQNGGRDVILDGVKRDKQALGYVRVTDADPCYFCQMLASRGLVYADDSFAESNPRFTGAGNAKVHDHCSCGMKPVYTRDDSYLEQSRKYKALWEEAASLSSGGGSAQVRTFRQLVEGRAVR